MPRSTATMHFKRKRK